LGARDEAELLREDVAAACRAAAFADLAGRPLYVVLTGEADGLRLWRGTLGLYWGNCDLAARAALEAAGRWRGRGPAFLLNHRSLALTARGLAPAARRAAIRSKAVGTGLHELAHALREPPREADPDPGRVTFQRAVAELHERRGARIGEVFGDAAPPPFWGHDLGWLRLALHLHHRAARAGINVTAREVFDSDDYQLSPTEQYLFAVGPELNYFLGWRLAEVLTMPAPVGLEDLYRADMERWKARHSEQAAAFEGKSGRTIGELTT
jgi:hypothetical protein